MRYFMYSPLDMSIEDAYLKASGSLQDNMIVNVTASDITIIPPIVGQTPTALLNTYLVRVEQDGSLRVVHRNLA